MGPQWAKTAFTPNEEVGRVGFVPRKKIVYAMAADCDASPPAHGGSPYTWPRFDICKSSIC